MKDRLLRAAMVGVAKGKKEDAAPRESIDTMA
jgi:hypothetical protein